MSEASKAPYPIRSGAIPTADGVFPVDLAGGGNRRRRRPLFNVEAEDLKIKAKDAEKAELSANETIAQIMKDPESVENGNHLACFIESIKEAAPVIRAVDLLASARIRFDQFLAEAKSWDKSAATQDPAGVMSQSLLDDPELLKAHEDAIAGRPKATAPAAQVDVVAKIAAFDPSPSGNAVTETPSANLHSTETTIETVFVGATSAETLVDFQARLAAMPDADVKAALGEAWDGNEDTFAESTAAAWEAAQPAETKQPDTQSASTPAAPVIVVPDPPKPKPAKKSAKTAPKA